MNILKNIKILFVASECTPLAKVGGLADVLGSLPLVLKKLGVDVRVCLPKYKTIDVKKYPVELVAEKIKVGHEFVSVYKCFLPKSRVVLYLLENDRYFGENGVYFEKTAFVSSFKEIERFLFFSKAIMEIFPAINPVRNNPLKKPFRRANASAISNGVNWFPDIIHCHDWHTAILPILAKLKCKTIRTLLTIHNLANQGKWHSKGILDFLGLNDDEQETLKIKDKQENFNILQQGILNADLLNTVSKRYAEEILTSEYGEGLEEFLLSRKKDLFGILNGLDEERFNPEKDVDIKTNYSSSRLRGKTDNKLDLQKFIGLTQDLKTPLLGMINRLTDQKGIDLIIGAIPEMVKMGCQLIILGVGAENYEKKLLELSQKYPNNISVQIKFDAVLAQKIYAGCDIFLMPSRFEPCGLGQMIAQRYGTLPLVRETGGLADTVENKKTGFVFKKYKTGALLESLKEALEFYKNQKKWKNLMKKAMVKDSSWLKSAKDYLKLYKKLLEK